MTTEEKRDAAVESSRVDSGFRLSFPKHPIHKIRAELRRSAAHTSKRSGERTMAIGAKIAKTADRKKVMDTSKSTDCPKCGKTTRIVKRMKDRERNIPGGIYISCSACDFYEKL
jgi:DNA-directed RNA polymerase subunit M/transcription elongation factor TFIIS